MAAKKRYRHGQCQCPHVRIRKMPLKKAGHALLDLPPDSPDLNPINNKWAQVKALRRTTQCTIEDRFKYKKLSQKLCVVSYTTPDAGQKTAMEDEGEMIGCFLD